MKLVLLTTLLTAIACSANAGNTVIIDVYAMDTSIYQPNKAIYKDWSKGERWLVENKIAHINHVQDKHLSVCRTNYVSCQTSGSSDKDQEDHPFFAVQPDFPNECEMEKQLCDVATQDYVTKVRTQLRKDFEQSVMKADAGPQITTASLVLANQAMPPTKDDEGQNSAPVSYQDILSRAFPKE